MIKNQKIKVLWITDIHFSAVFSELADKAHLVNFSKTFRNKISADHAKCPFDYIFITGDLAQTGVKGDYDTFKEIFLQPFLDELLTVKAPIPKVITIPGNHDVIWKKGEFLSDYIDGLDLELEKIPYRPEYLSKSKSKFKKLFQGYTDFITGEADGPYRDFFSLSKPNDLIVSDDYNASRLYGHVIDKKNKFIIVLLNTAWFSLGGGFNDLYESYIKSGVDDPTIDVPGEPLADLNKWLKTKDILTEYNQQITGIQLLKKRQLEYYFANYPDYFVVTCMHHSRNWLAWSESYSYPNSDQNNNSALMLKKLTNKSDLVLTGHEHVPLDIQCERIFDNILHLKGGCFMEYEKKNAKFSHSWYSILCIDTSTKHIEHEKYYYDVLNENWNIYEDPDKKKVIKYPALPKGNYKLSDKRKEAVLTAFTEGTAVMLKSYLEAYFPENTTLHGPEMIFEPASGNYQLYKIRQNIRDEFCILVKKPDLYYTYFNEAIFFNELTSQLLLYPEVQYVRFLVLDIFVDGKLRDEYQAARLSRDNVFKKIVKLADNLFDIFRYQFFMRWEPVSEENLLNTDIGFEPFMEVKMINQIIPYWFSERYWYSEDQEPYPNA